MDWYKQRTGYYLDPEMIDAGEEAEVLYNRAKSYAAQTESGGYIPAGALSLITPKRPAQRAAKLVQTGLWLAVSGGYVIVDWNEEQSGLEALASRRRADRDRKRAQRDRDRTTTSSRDGGVDTSRDSHGGVRSDLDTELEKEKELPPTDSLRSSVPPEGAEHDDAAKPKAKRATRIPDDFAITDAMRAWGRTRAPHVNGDLETEKFINYWTAKSGAAATKLDWNRTWENWILTAAERTPSGPRTPGGMLQPSPAGTNAPRPVAEVLAQQAAHGNGTVTRAADMPWPDLGLGLIPDD